MNLKLDFRSSLFLLKFEVSIFRSEKSQISLSATMWKHMLYIFLLSAILNGAATSACYTSEKYCFRTDV